MKKAQVTIFAILAIIILFTMLFLFYIISMNSAKDSEIQKSIIEDSEVVRMEIQEKMASCLNSASTNSLRLLGEQGGFYYKDQEIKTELGSFKLKGINSDLTLNSPWVLKNAGKNHTIHIRKRNLERYTGQDSFSERKYFDVPEYPCRSQVTGGFFNNDVFRDLPDCQSYYTIDKSIESISQQIIWPNLCNRNIPDGCIDDCVCRCFGEHCEYSVMNQLEDYVSKYFNICFKDYQIPGFENSYRENIDNKIKSFVGLSNIYFVLESQINLTSKRGDINLNFKNTKSNEINLKLAGFFNDQFSRMINQEGVLPTHNLIEELQSYQRFSDLQINVQPLYTRTEVPNKYDVIRLTLDGVDGSLDGRPFNFYIIRENRIPILEHIPRIQIPGNIKDFNITYRAVDPDEDKIHFIWDLMETAEKRLVDGEDTIIDEFDENMRTTFFRSKLNTATNGNILLSVCDLTGLCDHQMISIRQN